MMFPANTWIKSSGCPAFSTPVWQETSGSRRHTSMTNDPYRPEDHSMAMLGLNSHYLRAMVRARPRERFGATFLCAANVQSYWEFSEPDRRTLWSWSH